MLLHQWMGGWVSEPAVETPRRSGTRSWQHTVDRSRPRSATAAAARDLDLLADQTRPASSADCADFRLLASVLGESRRGCCTSHAGRDREMLAGWRAGSASVVVVFLGRAFVLEWCFCGGGGVSCVSRAETLRCLAGDWGGCGRVVVELDFVVGLLHVVEVEALRCLLLEARGGRFIARFSWNGIVWVGLLHVVMEAETTRYCAAGHWEVHRRVAVEKDCLLHVVVEAETEALLPAAGR